MSPLQLLILVVWVYLLWNLAYAVRWLVTHYRAKRAADALDSALVMYETTETTGRKVAA